MKKFEKHRSNIRAVAQKMKQALERGDSFKGSAFKEEYQHISELVERLSRDKEKIDNWMKLGRRLAKKSGVGSFDFLLNLEAAKKFLEDPKLYAKELEELCDYVGSTDLDDAKFVYKLNCLNHKDREFARAIELLVDYKGQVLEVEKQYYKIFYSFRAWPEIKYPIDPYSLGGFGLILLIAIKWFLLILVTFWFLKVAVFLDDMTNDIVAWVKVAGILSVILSFIFALWFDFFERVFELIDGFLAILFLFISFPVRIVFLAIKRKKCLKALEKRQPYLIKESFSDILKQAQKVLADAEGDSEINYAPVLDDVAPFLWNARTLEGAIQAHIDDEKATKEFVEEFIALAKARAQAEFSSSDNSYSSRSSHSASSDDGDYDPLSWKPDINQKERIGNKLYEKPIGTVAIYHSLVVDQWMRLDKWGNEEYVSIERTSYGDFFVARDGEMYKIKTFPLQRDEIYFYQPK